MQDPPDPQCADKPYKTALVITTDDEARVLKTIYTDVNGAFRAELPPGTYAIRSAAAANILPYCSTQGPVTVAAGAFSNVAVSCDTGIR
ncbi:hypothetical protein HYV30_01440 [Candidatus Kaiserbacteria bacterium]|nr:hypothetical protein [Candidatus Kaiserbacteria bacterium]